MTWRLCVVAALLVPAAAIVPDQSREMAAALKFSKYDYRFEYGLGNHNLAQGGAIMPESLKWLWREETKK